LRPPQPRTDFFNTIDPLRTFCEVRRTLTSSVGIVPQRVALPHAFN
jgi:hypothetical protein